MQRAGAANVSREIGPYTMISKHSLISQLEPCTCSSARKAIFSSSLQTLLPTPSWSSLCPSTQAINQVLPYDLQFEALPLHLDKTCQPEDLCGQIFLAEVFVYSGGYGDVHKGTLRKGKDGYSVVAVKVLQAPKGIRGDLSRFKKKLRREIKVWKRLNHDNIVPFLGMITYSGPSLLLGPTSTGMVSPWMENGNLNTFMDTKTLSICDRLHILCDVAAGLTYLHSEDIMHGDLTGANVLISDAGKACLIDFGLSLIRAEFEGTSYWPSSVGGAMRWRALELFPPNGDVCNFDPNLTPACDIYSFGSVALHVFSGKVPYHNIAQDICVWAQLFHGNRPERPPVPMLTDGCWEFIVRCWGDTPSSRPCAGEVHASVLDLLGSILSPPTPAL